MKRIIFSLSTALLLLAIVCQQASAQVGSKAKQPTSTSTNKTTKPTKKATPQPGRTTSSRTTRSARPNEEANESGTERTYWETIRDSDDAEDFNAYLRRYPNGAYADLARNRLRKLAAASSPAPIPRPTPTPQPASSPSYSSAQPTPTPLQPVRTVEFTDVGQVYSTANMTECFTWPSAEMKRLAGENSWGSGFKPINGFIGDIMWETTHCSTSVKIYIVRIFVFGKTYYVPIGASGVRLYNPSAQATPQPTPTRRVTFVDVGKVYPSINSTECLSWPSPEMKRLAGSSSWGNFKPNNGLVGDIIWETKHCSTGIKIYIVKVPFPGIDYYVPIGENGVKF